MSPAAQTQIGRSQFQHAKVLFHTDNFLQRLYREFVAVHCDELIIPLNGSVSSRETVFGTRVNFTCDIGFQLNGLRELTCFPNGSWSGDEPLCNGNA